MKLRIILLLFVLPLLFGARAASNPIPSMLERIDEGASKKFTTRIKKSPDGKDFFEISSKGKRVLVEGNNYVSIATGINWYLKHVAGVHLSWNGMSADLPEVLPLPEKTIRKSTDKKLRYDFNYCTYSYTMPFWNWERWEQEIDWMALHGVNLPLAAIGQECVWRNMLDKLGYTKEEINNFIAGPREMVDMLMMEYGLDAVSQEVHPKFFGTEEQRKRWLKIRYIKAPLFLRPFINFSIRYILKGGFLDGKEGFI